MNIFDDSSDTVTTAAANATETTEESVIGNIFSVFDNSSDTVTTAAADATETTEESVIGNIFSVFDNSSDTATTAAAESTQATDETVATVAAGAATTLAAYKEELQSKLDAYNQAEPGSAEKESARLTYSVRPAVRWPAPAELHEQLYA
jgi:hypothetical protein